MVAELSAQTAQHEAEIAQYASEVELLREQVKYLYDKLYGPKSEKGKYDESPQLPLFDMPEPDVEDEEESEVVIIEEHSRRKKGRKPLPEHLPRVEIVHDIDEEDKICHCGCQLTRIGEEVSEKLDIIPAVIQVVRHIRPKYSCSHCENIDEQGDTVKIAPTPIQLIPKGIASGGLMAHILTAKFADALPFYRQESQFARLGAKIPRATMCRWTMMVALACQPIRSLLLQDIRSGPLINVDETTVQVLDEPGRSSTSKSYMWIFRGRNSLLFHYHQSRSGDVAATFLDGYRGVVQTDGYVGYDFLDGVKGVAHIGCWAHARRKFMDAHKARPKKIKKPGSTDQALKFIKDIYRVEHKAKNGNISGLELLELRQKEAKPVLDKMHAWLMKRSRQVVPKSLLGKAISYTLKQWHRLIGYLEIPLATPDNNLAENSIRPFCVGRRNWLFSGTPEGAQASATIYSLIETAKANQLEPYKYLRFLFEKLPFAQTTEDYSNLLPGNLTTADLENAPRVSRV